MNDLARDEAPLAATTTPPEGALVARAKERSASEDLLAGLPEGVLVARVGAGANCSSAGSAIDILFYTSVIAGAIAVALSAAFPPRAVTAEGAPSDRDDRRDPEGDDPRSEVK